MSRRLDPENFVAEKLAWHQRIASDPTISLQAKAVAGFILHDLNPCEGGAWRGQESMSTSLGVSPRQLRRLLDELQTADYLEVEVRRGRGRTNICRATVPDEAADAPQNRSSAADQTHEKRPQATAQTPEKRTSGTRKPVTGDRQYLYEPISNFRAAESRRHDVGAGTPARLLPFAQADIRKAVVQIAGEGAAVSYLDHARWEPDERRILCSSATAFARLKDLVGRPLATRGVSIALQPCEPRQLAA
ncbi:hypothetical protein ASF31_02285 [Brevundimonas sp. Leaf280]|uniref:hypothetical protein n=1 Tax=Brevundimonas sp. Leaf280 TaxID=1736320 RepID=UPI0006FE42DC|nr:hypothetical protein [Brevundimonas sp. Leaf280]KQP48187.1 hypothetical protein ASF31_02285 [Brevundimonas sp. Leaf280]